MKARLREAAIPAYLLLCLLLGGSAQGTWTILSLHLGGIAIIAWSLLCPSARPLAPPARRLLALVAGVVLLGLLQLVPLAPSIWSALPGRDFIAEGYILLGQRAPWLPISLAPFETIQTLLTLIPPTAVLFGMLRLEAYRPGWLVAAIVAGTIGGVILGVLQVSSADRDSLWHLYPITNYKAATGFFANANHFAILLVAGIPFLAAVVPLSNIDRKSARPDSAGMALAGSGVALFAVGLFLNGSLAGVGLGLPVLLASALMLIRRQARSWRPLLVAIPLILAAAVALLIALPSRLGSDDAQMSFESRQEMARTSAEAAFENAPTGSGIGTFAQVYALYEHPSELSRTYVNHAHNDYLELAVETGLAGLILLLLFLVWWGRAAIARWRSPATDAYARAATIASAAILAHSIVDFPLRTAAIAALFAMCLALMAQPKARKPRSNRPDLRPARHLEIR